MVWNQGAWDIWVFLNNVLVIWSLLCFLENFRIILFVWKKSHWYCIESVDCLGLGLHWICSHEDLLGRDDFLGSWRSFLYSSSVYSCHLFLISSASVRSIPFLSFIEPIFVWSVPLVSLIFLERSSVFPILLISSISLHWSLREAFLSLFAVLWNSALRWVYLSFSPLLFTSLLFTAICKASPDNYFAFLHFFSMGMVFIPVSCTMSWTSVHSSSGTLSIRSSPLNLFLTFTV